LVFKEQVEESFALLELDAKEQVALGGGELGVNKGGRFEGEGAPVDGLGECGREVVLKKKRMRSPRRRRWL
jgi:hypothetical protein